jgi:predicted transcriptional regulator
MSDKVIEIIGLLKDKLDMSNPDLSKMLGFKSISHIWMIESGYRKPSFLLCKRLLEAAKECGIKDLTIDMLMDDNFDDARSG